VFGGNSQTGSNSFNTKLNSLDIEKEKQPKLDFSNLKERFSNETSTSFNSHNSNNLNRRNSRDSRPVDFQSYEQMMYQNQQSLEKNHRELMQALTGSNQISTKQEIKHEKKIDKSIVLECNTVDYNILLKSKLVKLLGFDLFMKQPFNETLVLYDSKILAIKSKNQN
jgi:hypothetical protein